MPGVGTLPLETATGIKPFNERQQTSTYTEIWWPCVWLHVVTDELNSVWTGFVWQHT